MNWLRLMALLLSINSIAIAKPPPPLPTDDTPAIETTQTEVQNGNKKTSSFFQKIKSFFGFKNTQVTITAQDNPAQNVRQLDKDKEEPTIELGDNKLPTLQEKDISKAAELSMPSGFQEEDTNQSHLQTEAQQTGQQTTTDTNQIDVKVTRNNESSNSITLRGDKPITENSNVDIVTEVPALPEFQKETIQQSNGSATQTLQNEIKSSTPNNMPAQNKSAISNNNSIINITPNTKAKLIVPKDITLSETHIDKQIKQKANEKNKVTNKIDKDPNREITLEQAKFVNDEAKVLLLPNDDVVLGELSEQAILDLMDISQYIRLLEQYELKENQLAKQSVIENFLANYDDNFHVTPNEIELKEAVHDSFDSITKDNLFSLRALLDNYTILQRKNKNNDNLLHYATFLNNYSLVKFLIMRGVAVDSFNNYHETPIMIALEHGNMSIVNLLKRAQYK